MTLLGYLIVFLVLVGLVLWGVQSLNPKGFNAAAKKGVDGAVDTVKGKVEDGLKKL